MSFPGDFRSEYSGKIIAPERFQETAIRAGHVPNAVNVPWSQAVQEDGRFKSAEDLKALYAQAGIDGSKPVMPRLFGGGLLLGFGAMVSLGCTVGVLLSGIMAGGQVTEMRLSVLDNGLSHERITGMKVRFSHLSLSERRKIERWRQMRR